MNDLISTVCAMIGTTPARWQGLFEALPEDLLRRPAAPGEWSAVECLEHLIYVEKSYQFRLQAFLNEQDFPNIDPDSEESSLDMSPVEMAAEFARLRKITLQGLDALKPEDLSRKARHPELGPVTLEQAVHLWAAHDLNHTVQAERALMQPFIAGVGPWQKYFTDHYLG